MASDPTFSDLFAAPGRLDSVGRIQQENRPTEPLSEALAFLETLSSRSIVPSPVEVRHLRGLLAIEGGQDKLAGGLALLDAVLDSPLDLDISVLQRIHARLRQERLPNACSAGPHVRFETTQHKATLRSGSPKRSKPRGESRQEWGALVSQMQGMNGLMQQQAEHVQYGLSNVEAKHTAQTIKNTAGEINSRPTKRTSPPGTWTIRGLRVCQGGHHFVLPIEKIEQALDIKANELPTVRGKPVAYYNGVLCDVIHLAGYLGLFTSEKTVANTLIVVSESGTRLCLAVDEVLGPVETRVTPMETILPKVTGLLGVATFESGGLALVPDLSRIVGVAI